MDSHAAPANKDQCGCGSMPEVTGQLSQGESVVFSCILFKKNRFGMKQERTLMLTNLKLYNVKKAEFQRTINLESIKALTKSLDPKRNTSFIVHVSNEYDYQFDSDDDIFTQIKFYYW